MNCHQFVLKSDDNGIVLVFYQVAVAYSQLFKATMVELFKNTIKEV